MMKDAESHADEDKKRREEIETRNRADQAVYGAERLIKDTGDKLARGRRQAIEAAIEAVKKAIEGERRRGDRTRAGGADAGAAQGGAKRCTSSRRAGASGAGGAGRRRSGGGGAAGGAGASGGQKGDVIDAEVVDEGKQ